jgi:hypothetical protein
VHFCRKTYVKVRQVSHEALLFTTSNGASDQTPAVEFTGFLLEASVFFAVTSKAFTIFEWQRRLKRFVKNKTKAGSEF